MITQGRRVYPDKDNCLNLQPCDYGRDNDGIWLVRTPNVNIGECCINRWNIIEHEDKTITASPSIMVKGGPDGKYSWHGFLEKGIWREV